MANADPIQFEMKADTLLLTHGSLSLPISLGCPEFVLNDRAAVAEMEIDRTEAGVPSDVAFGRRVELRFQSLPLDSSARLEVKLFLQWSAKEKVLRKWAKYRVIGAKSPVLLKRVFLEGSNTPALDTLSDDALQCRPVFPDGFFAGVEFPIAISRLEDGKLTLGHQSGLRMQPDVWYETKKAVYGVAEKGFERRAFGRYISAHRPGPKGFHLNYNSWWSCPLPYSQDDILKLMNIIHEKLTKPYGVSFDSFCIDLGWSEPKSFWGISTKLFPNGFYKIQQAAERMDSHLGLWVSPSNCYSPHSMETGWAKEQGYEAISGKYLCLAGKRYQNGLKERLVEMATRRGVRQFKFDGYVRECSEADHGHEPGALSAEAIAEGIIGVIQTIRKAAPDTWIEATCFGWNPSPWWMFTVNSVIGAHGDDYPPGRVPAPIYHESGTTARDYFNLQGAALIPIPVEAQEVLGIIQQSSDPFLNDAVMVVMRGNMFLPAYINPAYMDDSRWRMLADLLKWAKKNAPAMRETVPLLPVSWQGDKCPKITGQPPMPREPYGYAHLAKDRGLVALRNPWIAPQTYSMKLDETVGLSPKAAGLTAVSLYPEPRLYAEGLKYGDTIDIALAPYETIVLSFDSVRSSRELPNAKDLLKGQIKATDLHTEVSSVQFNGDKGAHEPERIGLLGDQTSVAQVIFHAKVDVTAPQAELLILMEGSNALKVPQHTIKVNGSKAEPAIANSDAGWTATQMPPVEHWLFLRIPLAKGENDISAKLLMGKGAKVSAWAWATRPGKPERSKYANSLPEPELVSLDATPILDTIDTAISGASSSL